VERQRGAGRRLALLNALSARQREKGEGSSLASRGVRRRSGEGGNGLRRRVSWHGTGVAALGGSDSGKRRTSRECGGRVRTGEAECTHEQGRRQARVTRGQRLTSGAHRPGARWVVVGCGRARQGGTTLTRGPGSTVPGGANSNWIQNNFKRIQIFPKL
jgi:hypothetical protein